MFTKAEKKIDRVNFRIGLRFLKRKLELVVDRLRCHGCGICSAVCPKGAIQSGPKTKLEGTGVHTVGDDNIILDVSDPLKCVYCGTCTYFCPFDAIRLRINGEEVDPSTLELVKEGALPKLEYKEITARRSGVKVKVYMDGYVRVKPLDNSVERDFKVNYVNNCPGECHACVDICPTGALEIMPYEEALKTGLPIKTDDSLCIACGACVMACPSGRIELTRTAIHISGSYNKTFMEGIAERLGVPLE